MRRALRILILLAALVGGQLGLASISNADPYATPSSDPISDDYSPWLWITVWKPAGTEYTAAVAADVRDGLNKTGMTISAQPAQTEALNETDWQQLTQAWPALLDKTYNRARTWSQTALTKPSEVPLWSSADADAVARDLGGTSYSSLSPGLKSVVQRIATIVTGDFKPPMPDDAWASWMPVDVRAAFDARPDQRFDWSKVSLTVDGSTAVMTVCDAGSFNWLCQTTRAAAAAVGATVDFATDPLGWLAEKAAVGASALMNWVAGVANHATAPDLTAAWWIDAYKKGMAIGILLFGLVLMWQLLQKSRGRIDSQELMETFTIWAPTYFVGVMFGPPLAQFMIVGSGKLTDGLVNSLTGFNAGDAANQVGSAIDSAGAGAILGGAVVGLVVLVLMIIVSLMVFLSLAAQAVTVYLAGAVFGVAFAWIVSARHRGGSMKIPLLFLGIVFSRPLLFFLLGCGLALSRMATSMSDDDAAANLATLVMAIVVLFIAAFAPLLLLKYAPVSPAGMPTGGGGISTGAAAGAAAAGGSMLGSMANSRAATQSGKAAAASAAGSGASGAGGAAASGDALGAAAAASSGAASGGGTGGGSGGGGGGGGIGGGGARRGAPSGTSRASSGAGRSVSQKLNRSPRSTGGTPSAQAAHLAAAMPQGRPMQPVPADAPDSVSPAGSSSGSALGSGARSAGRKTRELAGAAALGGARATMAMAPAARRGAHQFTGDLDGDQAWPSHGSGDRA
jgi:type IV secretion system protein TrbL